MQLSGFFWFRRCWPRLLPLVSLLLLVGLLTVSRAAAATYYVDATAPGGDGSSWAQAFATIGAALGQAQSGDTVAVSGGRYAESLTTVRDGVTVAGSTDAGHDGTVTIAAPDGQTALSVAHASTWRRLTFDGAANTDRYEVVVRITGGAPTFEQCVIGPGTQLLYVGPGGATFSRCTLQSARRGTSYGQVVTIDAGASAPVTFAYCLFADMQFGYIHPQTASRLDFDNCLLAGFDGYVLYSDADAAIPGGTHLQNCLLFGNGYSADYLIWTETAAAAVTLTNCLTQPRSPVDLSGAKYSANVSERHPLFPGSPGLTHGRRQALVNLGIDDAANVGFWTQVAGVCNAHGIPSTLALDAADVPDDRTWDTLQTQIDAGNEVAAHSAHHVVLSEQNLLTITYTGRENHAAVVVDSQGTAARTLRLMVDDRTAATFDLGAAATDAIGELRDAIDAVPDFSASVVTVSGTSYTTAHVLSRDLDAADRNLPARTAVALARNDSQFFADEIAAPKATIEAHLRAKSGGGAYVCDSFIYPFLDADAAVLAATGAAGFTAARGGYYGSFAMGGFYDGPQPGGYDVLNIWSTQPGLILGRHLDATTLRRRVSALLEWAKFTGAAIALFSHGAKEYDLDEWTALVEALRADPEVRFGTLQDLRAYVAANASAVSGSTYVRTTWPDVANYRPLGSSPLLRAGAPYDHLLRDFAGNPVEAGAIPSVGLYQRSTDDATYDPAPLLLLLLEQ